MKINLNIKANVDNLTLSDIYELLAKYKYSRENKNGNEIEFKGFKFKIEVEIDMSINYIITEVYVKQRVTQV